MSEIIRNSSGVYSYNPEQALDLLKEKPNAFFLLSLIVFHLSRRRRSSDRLEKDEVYFCESIVKMTGAFKPILTPSQITTSLKNLTYFGFIEIKKDPVMRFKIIKVLVNPFSIGESHV